jgi:predicted lipoprotein with Yx(FWY)xxD motif
LKKNNTPILIVIIVLVIVVVGGFAFFHKSTKTAPPKTTTVTTGINNSVVITKASSGVGTYLADPSDNALYTYTADSSGVSKCSGSCLSAWPAYIDKGSTSHLPANVGTIKRTDNGEIQYTYKGLPLYFFSGDRPGQITGNSVSGFTAAKP